MQRNAANRRTIQMRLHLDHQQLRTIPFYHQSIIYLRQLALIELDIDHRPQNGQNPPT